LPAGTQVLDAEVEIQTLGAFQDSKLGNMLRQLDQEAAAKSHFVTLTDRLSQKLIITVFVIAVVFFVLYAMKDFSQALNRSLALITLACPCALAFGSPLTLGLAVKRAQKMGILLKSSDTFEKILKIKNVFFDKTGTLTEGSLSLIDSAPQVIEDDLRKIILSLEAKSYHPIAFALRRVWFFESLYSVEDCEEILGQGLRGKIAGHQYEIRPLSETTHDSELAVEIFKDGISQCRLYFTDSLRTDSAQIVQELKNRNLNTFILSGDKKSRVAAIADSCGVAKDQSFGELFPEDKRDILCQYENTCMIGDGANDSLALKKADVGIAVKGSLDLSLQSADVYFTRGGLAPLLDLLQLGQHTRRVLVRNLTISLIYNFVGGVLALMGFINPMMAAILMPLSSFLIVLSSIGGLR
ncbi:MAG TPA: HAD-IC family P-type ATPase, partial [Bdellovibrio sp.]|nr:HAD-IC family P-type ATPase [Bdellovibrio sp.]